MQPPAQADMPQGFPGPQGGQRPPMQQRPGGPGMGGPPNGPQRPGAPMGAPGGPGGQPGLRQMGSMQGSGGPPGGQGPRPGFGGPPGGLRGPMGGPPGGPMGGPPGGPMGGPPGGPMGGPQGMRPGGPPGVRPMQPQMGGPGGPVGMQMRPPGGPMGGPQMQMMRGPPGQFDGAQRPMGGGGGTGGPPDMRGAMQGGPMPGMPGGMGNQQGRPDTGGMPLAQGRQQASPAKQANPTQKVVVYRPPRRTRGQVTGGDSEKEVDEDMGARGGLGIFKSLVVLGENGDLGYWNGFQWKGKRVTGVAFSKVTHDPEGRTWCINENWEVGRLVNSTFKSLGLLGNEFLVDLAFNPVDSSLWAVNRIGELLRWSGYSLERKAQHGFHKLKGISFDRKGNLWALNTACELAVWNENDEEWDVKDVPGSLRMTDLAFDERNRLWIIGPDGQLMLLSGSKWINFGFVGCWKVKDISFKVSSRPSSPAAAEKAE